jgi:hypothetical protein
MAVSAATIWYARSGATAAMANGGGFVTGASGTDYANQDAAQYNLTGCTSAGAGNVILTASAAADMVGNIAKAVSGTNVTVGWFEVTSVSVGVSITFSTNGAGASIATGVVAAGVINIGGALDLTGSGLDAWLEQVVGGNIAYIRSGTYTPAANQSVSSTLSTSTAPSNFIGYTSTPGDTCNGTDRPLFAMAANTATYGQYQNISNIRVTGIGATIFSGGLGAHIYNCSGINTSTSAGRPGLRCGQDGLMDNCEGVSTSGPGLDATNTGATITGCTAHDSNTGIALASSRQRCVGNIIYACSTVGVDASSASGTAFINANTIYGREAQEGIGVRIAASAPSTFIISNIIYGFTTGISQTTAQLKSNMGRNNVLSNNGTNATNYTLDSTDTTAINPSFTAAAQLTGATATISGSTLTQTGAFTANVTDGVSYLHVTGGTGATVGIYPIVSHTDDTVTVTGTIGTNATADKTWWIHYGTGFLPTGAV